MSNVSRALEFPICILDSDSVGAYDRSQRITSCTLIELENECKWNACKWYGEIVFVKEFFVGGSIRTATRVVAADDAEEGD